ncbi:LAMI_0D00408g1_1 [Lachancea mirantina]|uniref:LAMI_0D00408g1_1 n=1 Tax=Lachancea mirantina TaxID=1230905 RepID=A0A1G4J8U1_9SACH|nr:LAMI_0D00408g1_1 [Lachancea mirantina]
MNSQAREDLESQALDVSARQSERYGALPSVTPGEKVRKPWLLKSLLFSGVVSILGFLATYWAFQSVPSMDSIEKYFEDATRVQIYKISFVEWTSKEAYGEAGFSDEVEFNGQDFLKLKVELSVSIDHGSQQDNNISGMTERQKQLTRIVSNHLAEICLKGTNVTTFNDNETDSEFIALAKIPEPVCIDLRHNVTTRLEVPIYIKPDARNAASVIMKIWRRKFNDFDLWSSVATSVGKEVWRGREVTISNIKLDRIAWNDIIDWDDIHLGLIKLLKPLQEAVQVEQVEITDIHDGFRLEIGVRTNLPDTQKWLSFPNQKYLPSTTWNARLPDCESKYSISLENATFSIPSLQMRDFNDNNGVLRTTIVGEISGLLPEDLLYKVCSSDEENVVTPISKLIRGVFNQTELLDFEVVGHGLKACNESIVPLQFIAELIPMIEFALGANFTLDADQIVECVSMDGLEFKWVEKNWEERQLTLLGNVVSIINVPFYTFSSYSADESISIDRIKGITKLYHNDIHFLTVPVRVWTDAESEFINQSGSNTTQLRVSFDIAGKEVEVIDHLELTRCFNEIIIRGKSEIFVESTLDLMVSTKLGDFVLLGLCGEGKTVVRKGARMDLD